MAQLLSIEHDGPVRLRQLGKAGEGIDWTVEPARFPVAIKMVNDYGGPSLWEITPLSQEAN